MKNVFLVAFSFFFFAFLFVWPFFLCAVRFLISECRTRGAYHVSRKLATVGGGEGGRRGEGTKKGFGWPRVLPSLISKRHPPYGEECDGTISQGNSTWAGVLDSFPRNNRETPHDTHVQLYIPISHA